MLIPYLGVLPTLGQNVFIAEDAKVIGKVTLSDSASIWYNAVLRGDSDTIYIGKESNIQDLSVVHTDSGLSASIGDGVSVGHSCVLHGCTIGNQSLIGIGSIILNQAKIGECCLVGAGTLIPERKIYPSHTLILGTPGKVIRELTPSEVEHLKENASIYLKRAQAHSAGLQTS